MSTEPESPPPPPTVEAELTAEQVDDLFRDLTLCVVMQHISVKLTTDVRPEDRSTLLDDLDLVKARYPLDRDTTRAVQLRYEFDDALWIDTVTRRDGGEYHLLRIQHATDATFPESKSLGRGGRRSCSKSESLPMAEPQARASEIESLFPWLLHWSIADERIGGFGSHAFAVETPDGLMLIDALPLEQHLQDGLRNVAGLFLTHGNHQRSAWRLRKELDVPVYVPAGVTGLDEDADVWVDEQTALPGGLRAWSAAGFTAAVYLTFTHADGTGVLLCGDLICQNPGGPYRFPVEPSYFDRAGGEADARRLLELPLDTLCPAHATPTIDGCREALEAALSG